MANKKKVATTVVALTTAAALLLGGTFAWQSISQTALNEASDIVNPGGRLHNDMWYETAETTNSNVYVENFAEDEIFARVRLSEYMEIVMNYDPTNPDAPQTKVETIAGSKTDADGNVVADKPTDNTSGYIHEYTTHYFHEENATDEYWTWDTDGSDAGDVYYMPTFNVNKDSLAPDLNGLYRDRVGGISNREAAQYVDADGNALENYTGYSENEPLSGWEIYDADTNSDDELKDVDAVQLAAYIADGSGDENYPQNILQVEATHEADTVGATKGMMSLTDWLAMVEADGGEYIEADHGGYWVYDDSDDGDGWVYWSSPIAGKNSGNNTTGLLLDSFTLKDVMDDTWYYAIEVTGQFITADDLGDKPEGVGYGLRNTEIGGTGFYRDGETVSDNALELLRLIGVDTTDDEENSDEPEPEAPKTVDITTATEDYPEIHVNVYDTLKLNDQLMALEYEVDGEKITLVQDQQFIWSNSDPTCVATVVLTDETLVGEKITVVAKDVTGTEYRYAYLIVDGVAVKDDGEVEADYEVTLKNSDSDEMPTITVYSGESVKLNIVDENGEELTDYVFGLTDGEDHEQSDYYTYTHDEENNIIVINNVTEENVTVYANAVVLGETEEDNTYYIAEIIVLPETGGEEENAAVTAAYYANAADAAAAGVTVDEGSTNIFAIKLSALADSVESYDVRLKFTVDANNYGWYNLDSLSAADYNETTGWVIAMNGNSYQFYRYSEGTETNGTAAFSANKYTVEVYVGDELYAESEPVDAFVAPANIKSISVGYLPVNGFNNSVITPDLKVPLSVSVTDMDGNRNVVRAEDVIWSVAGVDESLVTLEANGVYTLFSVKEGIAENTLITLTPSVVDTATGNKITGLPASTTKFIFSNVGYDLVVEVNDSEGNKSVITPIENGTLATGTAACTLTVGAEYTFTSKVMNMSDSSDVTELIGNPMWYAQTKIVGGETLGSANSDPFKITFYEAGEFFVTCIYNNGLNITERIKITVIDPTT